MQVKIIYKRLVLTGWAKIMYATNSYSMRYNIVSSSDCISEANTFHSLNVTYDKENHVYEHNYVFRNDKIKYTSFKLINRSIAISKC